MTEDQQSLDAVILDEQQKLKNIKEKEQAFNKSISPTEVPGSTPLGSKTAVELFLSGNKQTQSLERILQEQNLMPQLPKQHGGDVGKAKRSKRYYIRKRVESGKPYIPARIRALGKRKARELGYVNWEERRVETREEFEDSESIQSINKLSPILKLVVKTRMEKYIRENKNKNKENK